MTSLIEDFESINAALKEIEAAKTPIQVSEGDPQDWTDVQAPDGIYSGISTSFDNVWSQATGIG